MEKLRSPEEEIIERMQVPEHPHVYVLGCFESRITLYTQQVRALNLIYALRNSVLQSDVSVAVIGAGAGGLTAAAAAAVCGCRVSVFEQLAATLSFVGPSRLRWLHPHIYDWPQEGAEQPEAGLPLLNWKQNLAIDVVDNLRGEWTRLAKEYDIETHTGATDISISPTGDNRYLLRWNGNGPASRMGRDISKTERTWGTRQGRRMRIQPFDIVILAVGFGVETANTNFPTTISYWDNDNIDAEDRLTTRPEKRVLVSGTGDGGLIDLLRYCFQNFRHERILNEFQRTWLVKPSIEEVKRQITDIEQKAQALALDNKPYKPYLNHSYRDLADSLILRDVPLRDNIRPVLTGKDVWPLDLQSSALSRFLFSLTNAEYIPGPITRVQEIRRSEYSVTFCDGREELFQDVVLRHGPVPSLEKYFPEIWKACATLREVARRSPDPTREQIYGKFYDELITAGRGSSTAAVRSPSDEELESAVLRTHATNFFASVTWRDYRQELFRGLAALIPAGEGIKSPEKHFVMPHLARVNSPTQSVNVEADLPRSVEGRGQLKHKLPADMSDSTELLEVAIRADALTADGTHCIVVGDAGSGKTTLLRHLAWLKAQDNHSFPIFVKLRALGQNEFENSKNLVNLLFEAGATQLTIENTEELLVLRKNFKGYLARGQVAFYLDGLDELASEVRPRFLTMVNDFLSSALADNSLVLSTRSLAISPGIQGIVTYKILPPSLEQIQSLFQTYSVEPSATRELMLLFAANPSLRSLVRTPSWIPFLTKVVVETDQGTKFKLNRLRLYKRVVEYLVRDLPWQSEVLRIMKLIAYRSLLFPERFGQVVEFTRQDVQDVAQVWIEDEKHLAAVSAVALSAPLISEITEGTYQFIHRFIEEFFIVSAVTERWEYLDLIGWMAFDPVLAQGDIPAMTIALIEKPDNAFSLLESLPDSIDRSNLRICARALRYTERLAQERVESLAKELCQMASDETFYFSEIFERIVADFAGASEEYAPTLVGRISILLQDPEPQTRRMAARTLGTLRSIHGVAPLNTALKDPLREVREEAARALGEIGDSTSILILRNAYLHDEGPMVFEAALKAIIKIGGSKAVMTLLAILEDSTIFRNLRWPVARALGETGDSTVLEPLVKALKDEAASVREGAARGLGLLGDPHAGLALRDCLVDPETLVRYEAIEALGNLRDTKSIGHLLSALKDVHPMVRDAAARALTKIDKEALEQALRQMVRDHQPAFRSDAAGFLGESMGKDALDVLLLLARDSESEVRRGAARGLTKIVDNAAVEALLQLADDPSAEVRRVAIGGLGRMPHQSVLPKLMLRLQSDDDDLVRIEAAQALGNLGDRSAVTLLCQMLESEAGIAQFSALALGKLGDEGAIQPLLAMCRRVRGTSLNDWPISAIARIGGRIAARALNELFQTEDNVGRRRIILSLPLINDVEVVFGLLLGFSDEDSIVRMYSREGLSGLARPLLKAGLQRALAHSDPLVRREAAQLVPFYADEATCELLEKLANSDKDPTVILSASEALLASRRKLDLLSSIDRLQ